MTRRAVASISMFLLAVAPIESGAAHSGQQRPADAETSAREEDAIPCGTLSLYVLCRLEGRKVDLTTVAARLPEDVRAGHSLAEIRDAAAECGLRLRGVRLRPSDWPLDRPALVHLDRHSSGHFVVIRPVGQSGRLAQVIDGRHRVEVLDFERLVSSPEWTGLALIPGRPNWAGGAGVALAIAASGLVVSHTVARLRQRVVSKWSSVHNSSKERL